MEIFQYKDYEEYVKYQTEANKHKIDGVYVHKDTIRSIAKNKRNASNIICHGTRNGAEQKYFKKHFPDAYVVGTEISETATQFPMTVQWDFTIANPEWLNKFDIVYSNSFDHSIDPKATLTTWRDQLTESGRLYLEHSTSPQVNFSRAWDPLAISSKELVQLLNDVDLKLVEKIKSKVFNGTIYVCEK